MQFQYTLVTLVLITCLASCQPKKNKEQSAQNTETPSHGMTINGHGSSMAGHGITLPQDKIILSNLTLNIPDGWKNEMPSSNMRVAQLSLIENPEIQIAVFFFGEQDLAQENIDRWKGQFSKVDDFEKLKPDNKDVLAVKILGTLKKTTTPMSQEYVDTPDQGTLAAIVPSETGPYYLKVSATKAEIQALEMGFMALLNSIQAE